MTPDLGRLFIRILNKFGAASRFGVIGRVNRINCFVPAAILLSALSAFAQDPHAAWRDFGGAPDSSQFSSLTQFTRANVATLQVAWTYPIGENKRYNFNPVVVDDVMYVMGRGNSIVALSAGTGWEVWRYQPPPGTSLITNRGINYWESKDRAHRHRPHGGRSL